jgi:hypothetical protein
MPATPTTKGIVWHRCGRDRLAPVDAAALRIQPIEMALEQTTGRDEINIASPPAERRDSEGGVWARQVAVPVDCLLVAASATGCVRIEKANREEHVLGEHARTGGDEVLNPAALRKPVREKLGSLGD